VSSSISKGRDQNDASRTRKVPERGKVNNCESNKRSAVEVLFGADEGRGGNWGGVTGVGGKGKDEKKSKNNIKGRIRICHASQINANFLKERRSIGNIEGEGRAADADWGEGARCCTRQMVHDFLGPEADPDFKDKK